MDADIEQVLVIGLVLVEGLVVACPHDLLLESEVRRDAGKDITEEGLDALRRDHPAGRSVGRNELRWAVGGLLYGPDDLTLGETATLDAPLTVGTHVLTLTVNDGQGGTQSTDVTIEIQDTTGPTLSGAFCRRCGRPFARWPRRLRKRSATRSARSAKG